MSSSEIIQNIEGILKELPKGVTLVAAVKARTPQEIKTAIDAGVSVIGQNYIQEAATVFSLIGKTVKWHYIGHLQKNKVKKAVEIFDMIETVDSIELARQIDNKSRVADKIMPVLVEINSARESQKYGVFPEKAQDLVEKIAELPNLKISGLMTMGPFFGDPEDSRPYFTETRNVFDRIKAAGIPGTDIQYLSMGMTNSYRIAIEEGANMVRIGTKIFGNRET